MFFLMPSTQLIYLVRDDLLLSNALRTDIEQLWYFGDQS